MNISKLKRESYNHAEESFFASVNNNPILMIEFFDSDYHFYGTNSFNVEFLFNIFVEHNYSLLKNDKSLNNMELISRNSALFDFDVDIFIDVFGENFCVVPSEYFPASLKVNFKELASFHTMQNSLTFRRLLLALKSKNFYAKRWFSRAANTLSISNNFEEKISYLRLKSPIYEIWSDIKPKNKQFDSQNFRSGFATNFVFLNKYFLESFIKIFSSIDIGEEEIDKLYEFIKEKGIQKKYKIFNSI